MNLPDALDIIENYVGLSGMANWDNGKVPPPTLLQRQAIRKAAIVAKVAHAEFCKLERAVNQAHDRAMKA